MIPIEKVQTIIARHDELEKELSSGKIDAKLFAQKSKEYSSLGGIILIAKSYVNFDQEKKDLQQIIQDKNNDSEMIEMAEKDLNDLLVKEKNYENKLTIFLVFKCSKSFLAISIISASFSLSFIIFSKSLISLSNFMYSLAKEIIFPKFEYSLDFWANIFGSTLPEDKSFSRLSCLAIISCTFFMGIIV